MDAIRLIAVVMHLIASAQSVPQTPGASWTVGKATYYHKGLMEGVADYRGIELGGASGFSTYPDCSQIGKTLRVSVLNPVTQKWSPWERKRIVDCSQTVDYARHKREGLVELSWEDAKKYGYRGEGRTQVRFTLER